MKQCKPCITIREIIKIIYRNIKLFYFNVRRDIKSYSALNATVCIMDEIPYEPVKESIVENIRKTAAENYLPTETHGKRLLADGAKNWLNSIDRSKTDPRVIEWAEKCVKDAM